MCTRQRTTNKLTFRILYSIRRWHIRGITMRVLRGNQVKERGMQLEYREHFSFFQKRKFSLIIVNKKDANLSKNESIIRTKLI